MIGSFQVEVELNINLLIWFLHFLSIRSCDCWSLFLSYFLSPMTTTGYGCGVVLWTTLARPSMARNDLADLSISPFSSSSNLCRISLTTSLILLFHFMPKNKRNQNKDDQQEMSFGKEETELSLSGSSFRI
jgi:hypothetical protein